MSDFSPDNYPVIQFDDDAWLWFVNACNDIESPPDNAKKDALQRIYSHLLGVNEWLNLTRIISQHDYLKFHVFDSLTILETVRAFSAEDSIVLDLGSGGGYPALPLMLWCPDRLWRLVDSRPRKVQFLKEAIKLTPAQHPEARVFRGREAATAAPDLFHKCTILTARAVGRAVELLPDAQALLAPNGLFIIMKGHSYPETERDAFLNALPDAGFTLVQEQNIALDDNDPDRWIISIMKTGDPAGRHHKKSTRKKGDYHHE